ncbi:MAG: ADP-ribosylglycohydrolase family protein [Myxococcaceae bacterium]|nr:ADP-ribosylglycohydrolase family protein [Myxococcaceae bacterium]
MPLPPSRLRKPTGPAPEQLRDRSRGALLGLAVGDAFGTTQEFKQLPAPPFPQFALGPQTEILGGGPFQLRPGQVTDDTQMAVALAQSLRGLQRYDQTETFRRYKAWLPHAFDVGQQTRAALEGTNLALGPDHGARTHWIQNAKRPAGNGSLMRTAPIGVYFSSPADREARIRASLEDSAITHVDPRCQLACVAFNAAVAAAIHTPGTVQPSRLVSQLSAELSIGAATLGRTMKDHVREVQEAVQVLREDLRAAEQDDPRLYGPDLHLHLQAGFVRVAFRLAFWELFHAPSFEAAIIDVANRGGDADTNAAITGALLGAVYGEQAIPSKWRAAVLEALPIQPALRDVYHPRELLPLAG